MIHSHSSMNQDVCEQFDWLNSCLQLTESSITHLWSFLTRVFSFLDYFFSKIFFYLTFIILLIHHGTRKLASIICLKMDRGTCLVSAWRGARATLDGLIVAIGMLIVFYAMAKLIKKKPKKTIRNTLKVNQISLSTDTESFSENVFEWTLICKQATNMSWYISILSRQLRRNQKGPSEKFESQSNQLVHELGIFWWECFWYQTLVSCPIFNTM